MEILISLTLLSAGVASIAVAFSMGIAATAEVESVKTAMAIAQARMEVVKNTSFASVSGLAGSITDATFSNYTVTTAVSGTDPLTVTVSVSWSAAGGSPSVSLATLVANV